jgi:sugar phosphate isomerase/epimerase
MFFQETSVCEALEKIARYGFQAAEVWMHHLFQTYENPKYIARRGQALGLELSLHAAAYDVNVTSTTPGIREESLRQIYQSIVTAAQLEAKIVIVHPGRLSTGRGSVETCWQLMNTALAQINEWALAEGIPVGLESMEKRPKEVFVTPADMMRLLRPEWKAIGFTLDLAHAYTFMDPVAYIEQFDPQRMLHVHFSDSGDHAVHAPLGTGKMDLPAALSALSKKFNGLAIIEGYVPGRGDETVSNNAAYLKKLGWI